MVNKKIFDPVGKVGRLYVVGSKTLKVCYVGTCLSSIIHRIAEHVRRYKCAHDIMMMAGVIVCVLGYFKNALEFKGSKQLLEYAIVHDLEGVNDVKFLNVQRNFT